MAKIPWNNRDALDNDVESDRHIRLIANKLTGWDLKPDLLLLDQNPDVNDIKRTRCDLPLQSMHSTVFILHQFFSITYYVDNLFLHGFVICFIGLLT